MNVKCLMITSSIALTLASLAQAADVNTFRDFIAETPVIITPTFAWRGFYLGGQIGNFSSKTKVGVFSGDGKISVDGNRLPKLSGFVGGFYAGSNVEFYNGFILGVDTDFILANKDSIQVLGIETIKRDHLANIHRVLRSAGIKINDRIGIEENDVHTNSYTLKEKWAGAMRVRVGFSVGRILPYFAGGVAYTQLQDVASISIAKRGGMVIASGNLSDETKSLVGYILGGGADFAMTDNVILRAEYRHSNLGKKKFAKGKHEVSYKVNDFRAGIAYKF
ncbi:outer membrane protein [Bartonella sp. CB189]|uniref:outer membrane protein n=1 Tax=Bartonella sp. CB189 TaxID=3112254 RepID=UPI002F9699D8